MVSDDGDEGRMPPCTRNVEYSGIYSNETTYHLKQLRHRFTGSSTDVEPVLYPLHAPLNGLRVLARLEARVVDPQELDGLCVSPLSLVNCDYVKDAVVADAVNGHPEPDSHGGKRCSVQSEEMLSPVAYRDLQALAPNRAALAGLVLSQNTKFVLGIRCSGIQNIYLDIMHHHELQW